MSYEEALHIMQRARVITPALIRYGTTYHVFSRTRLLGSGETYEAALRAAKLYPLPPSRKSTLLFGVEDTDVFRGEQFVCSARSHNIARRIAAALNAYTPSDRGY